MNIRFLALEDLHVKSPALILASLQFILCVSIVFAQDKPEPLPLRVASVTPAAIQVQRDDKSIIFHDEFDQPPDKRGDYFEYTSEKRGAACLVLQQGTQRIHDLWRE